MEHLSDHPHAFVDAEGNVKQVLIFSGHEQQLLNLFKEQSDLLYGEKLDIICCCDYGIAGVEWKWDGFQFIPPTQ